MKLKEIKSNIMEIKPLINNVISKERLNIVNQYKVYHYDDLIKLNF